LKKIVKRVAFVKNVLMLCTANSARSILGEALLNRYGAGRFKAFSAGSRPRGEPNPDAVALLADLGYDTASLRSKSWDEFAAPGAPQMDIVITVCDSAAGESCPIWPGAPVTAHWGIPDPADKGDTPQARRAAFESAYALLEARIRALCELSVESMDLGTLKHALNRIGGLEGATDMAKDRAQT
jgi:arsenate reductase